MGSNWNCNPNSYETNAQRETECQRPWMELICAVGLFGVYLKSDRVTVNFPPQRVPTETTYSIHTKLWHDMKHSAKHPEWSSYAPKVISACISNPSMSVWNFPTRRVTIEATNSTRRKSRHDMKLSAQHPECNSYAPLLNSPCISDPSKSVWSFPRRRVPLGNTNSKHTKPR